MVSLLLTWSVVYAVIAFLAGLVAVVAQRLERPDVSVIALAVLALTWTLALICLIFSKRAG